MPSAWRSSATRKPPRRWRVRAATSSIMGGAGSTITASTKQPSESISALSVETIRRLTGTRPIGWYIGTPGANTRRLVVEEGGFLYDSDAYNDELPYWTYDYGRPHLIIPHTLDDNDTRLARGLGWGQAEDFFVSLRDNFDALHREGEQTPKMMTVALHCRLAGKPARAAAFARFVDHILRHDRVWICRRNEIAEHWRRQRPAARRESMSEPGLTLSEI